jgi:hypothetical protein
MRAAEKRGRKADGLSVESRLNYVYCCLFRFLCITCVAYAITGGEWSVVGRQGLKELVWHQQGRLKVRIDPQRKRHHLNNLSQFFIHNLLEPFIYF